ncbi:MAG: restriction endonuclease subunit S [Nannocystaceae bacterium]
MDAETWLQASLGDDILLVSGQHIDAVDYNDDPSGYPYLTGPADFPDGIVRVTKYTSRPKTTCEKGDILLTVKGSGTGKLALAADSYCISRQLMAVRPKSWDRRFVYFTLESLTESMRRAAVGFIPGITRSDVLDAALPLPPLPEQRKIAAILSSVDEAIEKTQAVIDQVQVVKKGLMQELLTRGLPGRHKKFKQTEIGEIPEEWDVVALQELVAEDATITYGIVQAGPHIDDGVPYIKTGDMRREGIREVGLGRTSREIAARYHRSAVKTGDLVYSIRASVGMVHQVPNTLDGANLTQGTARISPAEKMNNRFLLWALRGPSSQQWIERRTKGTTYREITLKTLRAAPLAVPSLTEQAEISASIDAVEERGWRESKIDAALVELKQALMSVLLTGELRVTPDPAT